MSFSKDLQANIDRFFVDYDNPRGPGCALGVILDGKLVYARGYGMADLEQQVPNTPDTVFHLASVSKQFTAACVALLEEAGELSLEDAVKRFLAYLPDYAQALTLKHLVYMTNGLDDIYDVACLIMGIPEDSYFSQTDAIEIMQAAQRLNFEPGEGWAYGNTGYFLLGRVVEQVSGQSLDSFAREHIFAPLGMDHTFFRHDRRTIIPRRANGYARAAYFNHQNAAQAGENGYAHHREMMELTGAGQAWSTVNDLYRWDQNFYHNVLGKGDARLIERLTTPGCLNDGTPTRYAFGLLVTQENGCKVISHEGGSCGANTVIYRIPEKKFSFICLANSNDFLNTLFKKYGPDFYEQLAGLVCPWEPLPSQPAPLTSVVPSMPLSTADKEAIDCLAGKYQDIENAYIWEVRPEDQGVSVCENFAQEFSIRPATEGAWQGQPYLAESRNLTCTFQRWDGAYGEPYNRIVVAGQGRAKPHIFQRLFSEPWTAEAGDELAGDYVCQRLKAGYRVIPVATGIRLQNLHPGNVALNVVFTSTTPDMFLAQYPPAIGWYVVHFRRDFSRDTHGRITGFVFRDEVPGRENWVFERSD